MPDGNRIDLDAQKRAKEQFKNQVPSIRWSDSVPNSVKTNRFYTATTYGGLNTFTIRTRQTGSSNYDYNPTYFGNPKESTLPNCTSYAAGRFCEIAGKWIFPNMTYDATGWWDYFQKSKDFKTGQTPEPGALMCFHGHVEVVEKIIDDDTIMTTGSGYYFSLANSHINVWLMLRRRQDNWMKDARLDSSGKITRNYSYGMINSKEYFQGFVYNPSIDYDSPKSSGGALPESLANDLANDLSGRQTGGQGSGSSNTGSSGGYDVVVDTKEVTTEITRDTIRTSQYSGQLNTHSTGLLTIPTYVEAPYISVRFGKYVLGTYTKNTSTSASRITEVVQYPNYINSLQVTKINGAVNQYTIGIIYQIEPGQDPNFIDKVLSSVQYGNIYISYGDCNAPNFYYKEEEALIINVSTQVDFSSSRIGYTISATSGSFQLYGGNNYFAPRPNTKPSDVIYEIFKNENYGIKKLFKGMSEDNFNQFVARNDRRVNIEEKRNTDPLSYINYLVTCMIDEKDSDSSNPLKSSNYYMVINDDQLNDYGGSYFTVKEVFSTTKTLYSMDTYEVDIGFPTTTMVENFSLTDSNSWALLYKYSEEISPINYTYHIDNQGNILTEYSPSILTSGARNTVTPLQKTWWTQMTQFPISATLTIKGLVRPAMLMTYIRVNAMFYGQRHISSGLYVITGQKDTVDARGYRTTLSLQRIASDEDYITRQTETVTTTITTLTSVSKNNQNTNTTTGPVPPVSSKQSTKDYETGKLTATDLLQQARDAVKNLDPNSEEDFWYWFNNFVVPAYRNSSSLDQYGNFIINTVPEGASWWTTEAQKRLSGA